MDVLIDTLVLIKTTLETKNGTVNGAGHDCRAMEGFKAKLAVKYMDDGADKRLALKVIDSTSVG